MTEGRQQYPRAAQQAAEQAAFYAHGTHAHLQAGADDFYARKLTRRLVSRAGIQKRDTVLEPSSGPNCVSAVDISLSSRPWSHPAVSGRRAHVSATGPRSGWDRIRTLWTPDDSRRSSRAASH